MHDLKLLADEHRVMLIPRATYLAKLGEEAETQRQLSEIAILKTAPEPAPAFQTGELRYRLATTVPDHWIPLVPTRQDPGDPDIRLVRGRVLLQGSNAPVSPPPLGRLLEPGRPLRLFEEEVTRAGARITRAYQYVRWTDGSGHLWIGRQKGAGRGEGGRREVEAHHVVQPLRRR